MDSRVSGNDMEMGIKFHLDPAMLQQLQNASGFTPVIINIEPLKSLAQFLGLNEESLSSKPSVVALTKSFHVPYLKQGEG